MDCPKCRAGKIHVIKKIKCSCGHHAVACDACITLFLVECGEPYGAGKLPPTYPISELATEQLLEAFAEMTGQTLSEVMVKLRKGLATDTENLPLVEDFNDQLASETVVS